LEVDKLSSLDPEHPFSPWRGPGYHALSQGREPRPCTAGDCFQRVVLHKTHPFCLPCKSPTGTRLLQQRPSWGPHGPSSGVEYPGSSMRSQLQTRVRGSQLHATVGPYLVLLEKQGDEIFLPCAANDSLLLPSCHHPDLQLVESLFAITCKPFAFGLILQ